MNMFKHILWKLETNSNGLKKKMTQNDKSTYHWNEYETENKKVEPFSKY